jgi:hypothetical protein
VLSGKDIFFTWNKVIGATDYQLWLGSTGVGSHNLYESPAKTATSVTADNLPTNGKTIYARLITMYKGETAHIDYKFTAAK